MFFRLTSILLGLMACGCSLPDGRTAEIITMQISGNGTTVPCSVRYREQVFEIGDLERRLANVSREATIGLRVEADAPYRCAGSLIYTLQSLGFEQIVALGNERFAREP